MRTALATAAVLALLATPVVAQQEPMYRWTPLPFPAATPPEDGDLVLGIVYLEDGQARFLGGGVIQPADLAPVCGPTIRPERPKT